MASVSILVGCEERESRVERVVSVGVTDGSSLVLGGAACEVALVHFTGLLTACGGVGPLSV